MSVRQSLNHLSYSNRIGLLRNPNWACFYYPPNSTLKPSQGAG